MLKRLAIILCLLALSQPFGLVKASAQDSNPQQDAKPDIPAGTEIQLSLSEPLSSKLSEPGDEVIATVRRDVVIDGRTVLTKGTEVIGRVTLAEPAKRPLKGGRLHITFDRIRFNGLEQKITAVINSASDFTRDEKIKGDGEGTLNGGKDGGKVLQGIGQGAAIGMIGVTIAILAGSSRDGGGFGFGGISRGGALTGASVLGASVITGVMMTKGKEVRLDANTVIRLKLERPLTIG